MRVAVFGSPDFAVPALEAIHARHEVPLVVTQPDRPAGRGMAPRPAPMAARARELGLPLAQPARLRRNATFREQFEAVAPDVAVTAAYGNLLPEALLRVPAYGFLNVHASLLPTYRGAAPIQWALIEGATETGVTIMQTTAGLDTGPVRHVRRTSIGPYETAPDLFDRLALLGADAIVEALDLLARDALPCEPQDDAMATHAPLLSKEDGRIRWADRAQAVFDRYRGVKTWPGSFFEHREHTVKVAGMRLADGAAAPPGAPPGRIVGLEDGGLVVACGAGAVRLDTVTPAGKRAMDAAAWARGAGLAEGDDLA